MKLMDIFERVSTKMAVPQTRFVKLYYGCCKGTAEALEKSGFTPSPVGRKHLTLVSTPEMAKTMSEFRECDALVEVDRIPANYLQIDFKSHNPPKDIWEAIDRVNDGGDVILKLSKGLGAGSFTYINKVRKK